MKRIEKVVIRYMNDDSPDTSDLGEFTDRGEYIANLSKPEQDYERMEGLVAGNWGYIGIRAEAVVSTSVNGKEWLNQKIASGGLWGIESDSDKGYFKEVEREELAQLKTTLRELGFSSRQIEAACKADVVEMVRD